MSSTPEPVPSKPARSQRKRSSVLAQVRAYAKEDWRRFWRELRRSIPGVAVSLAIHIVVLLILGLIVFSRLQPEWGTLEFGWSTVVEKKTPEATPEQAMPVVLPSVSLGNQTTVARTETVPTQDTAPVNAVEPNPEVKPADVSQSLKFRQQDREKRPKTGTPDDKLTPEEAIAAALKWLSQQQQPEGSWSLQGPYPDGGSIETKTGATAMALLAFLGDGHTHKTGEYQSAVHRGLQWLIKNQRPNGDLFDSQEEGREPHFYAHAQGTIALCEALALTGDPSLRQAAENAVQFLIKAQNPVLGGWKYRPLQADGIGDLSVTGWVLMALHTARMANIEVPFDAFLLSERFLNSVQESAANAAMYRYRPDLPAEESQRHSMTAEGLLCRQWLGWPKNHPAMRRGVDFLMSEKNEPRWSPNQRNVYAWYYTAQALHNLDGPEWKTWYSNVARLMVKQQARGSWHPFRPSGAFQERSRDGGRLYLTVMCVLILETPFRHAPLFPAADPLPAADPQ